MVSLVFLARTFESLILSISNIYSKEASWCGKTAGAANSLLWRVCILGKIKFGFMASYILNQTLFCTAYCRWLIR
ncbi:MAG: hypothetical protein QM683_16155, partial [Lacrimispora sp.]